MGFTRTRGIGSELVSKAAFLYIAMVGSAGFGYLNLYLAVRYVGEVEYGIVAFALSFEGLFAFITDMGFSRSHTKKVSEGGDLRSCYATFLYVRLVLTAIYALILLLSILSWEVLFSGGYEYPETHTVILVLLLYNVFVSLRWISVYTFYAQRQVIRAQVVMISETSARVAFIAIVVLLNSGAIGLAWAFAGSGAVSLSVAALLSRNVLSRGIFRSFSRELLREYVHFASPIAVALVLATVALYLDKVIIQIFQSTVETGAYFASQRFLALYVSLGAAVSVLTFPAISSMSAKEGNSERIAGLVSETSRYLCLVVVPVSFFLVLFSGEILRILLAPELEFAKDAFAILSVSYGLFVITTPLFSQALGLGYASEYARYSVAYSLTVITMDILLIPSEVLSVPMGGLGIEGAAWALLIAQVVNTLMFVRNAMRISQLKAPRGVVRMLLSSVASAAIASYVASLLVVDGAVELVFVFLVLGSAYLCLVLLMRAVTTKEMLSLLRRFSLRNLREQSP